MVGEPVQQCAGQTFRAEYLGPFVERQVGGHQSGAALGVASGRYGAEQGALPPQSAELIERIFRSTHILVSLKRDELIRDGRGEELDELVKSTQALQKSLLEGELSDGYAPPRFQRKSARIDDERT